MLIIFNFVLICVIHVIHELLKQPLLLFNDYPCSL